MAESENDEMSFWEHLELLRRMLFRIAVFISVVAVVLFSYMKILFDTIILAPSRPDFFLYNWLNVLSKSYPIVPDSFVGDFQVKLININLSSQFMTHMTTTFWCAVVLSAPYIIFEMFRFVKPALESHSRKQAGVALVFATLMFYAGIALAYFLVFPLTLRFLAGYQLSAFIESSVSLDSYIDSFIMLSFIMGLVFELPLLSWLLSKVGLLHRSFFTQYRRYAVVLILIIAAFITPSSDPFTLMIVFIPVYMLWEISALVVRANKA